MKRSALLFAVSLLAAAASLLAQSAPFVGNTPDAPAPGSTEGLTNPMAVAARQQHPATIAPFSRIALGGGISTMGINMQAAVNANRYMNIRGVGNFFNYSLNNLTVSGFSANGTVNLATAGVSLDIYPFPNHGFRVSPGALFYNQNHVAALGVAPAGTSVTIDGTKYYSETSDPLTASGSLLLNPRKQAFTMTTGWGNLISRRGGHWSLPVEVGAAFVGAPTLTVVATGSACLDQAQTMCSSITGSNSIATQFQSNLSAQIAKWNNDLNPLRFYPIVNFGIAYNFGIRSGATRVASR